MEREIVQPTSGRAVTLPYSPGVRAGGFIFVSGSVSVDPASGQLAGKGDVRAQTRQVLENIRAVLMAGGSSLEKVVKSTVFLTHMADFSEMNDVYREFFPVDPPARSTVGVNELARGEFLVEIEVVALA